MAWTKNIVEIGPYRWSYVLLQDGFQRVTQPHLPCSGGVISTEQIANLLADLLLAKITLGLLPTVTRLEQTQILFNPDSVDTTAMATAAKVVNDAERASCAAHFKPPFGG